MLTLESAGTCQRPRHLLQAVVFGMDPTEPARDTLTEAARVPLCTHIPPTLPTPHTHISMPWIISSGHRRLLIKPISCKRVLK